MSWLRQQPACALLFYTPSDKTHVETSMIEYSTKQEQCKRTQLFLPFDSDSHSTSGCRCIFVCVKSCKCGHCDTYISSYVYHTTIITVYTCTVMYVYTLLWSDDFEPIIHP